MQKPLAARWQALTHVDLAAIDGHREKLVHTLANRMGIPQHQAANELAAFEVRRTVQWRPSTATSQTAA